MSRLSEIGDLLRGFRLVTKSAQGEAVQRIMQGWQFSSFRSTMDDLCTGIKRSKSRSTVSNQLPDSTSDAKSDPLSSIPKATNMSSSNTHRPSDDINSNAHKTMSTLISDKVAVANDTTATTTSIHSSNNFQTTPSNQLEDRSQSMISSLNRNAFKDTLAFESSSILQDAANRTNTSHGTIQHQVDSTIDHNSNEHMIEEMMDRTEKFSQAQNINQLNTSVPEQTVIFFYFVNIYRLLF